MRFKSVLARPSNVRIVRSSSTSALAGVVCKVGGAGGGFGSSAGFGGSGGGGSGLAGSGGGASGRCGSRGVFWRARWGGVRARSGARRAGGGGLAAVTAPCPGGGGGGARG